MILNQNFRLSLFKTVVLPSLMYSRSAFLFSAFFVYEPDKKNTYGVENSRRLQMAGKCFAVKLNEKCVYTDPFT